MNVLTLTQSTVHTQTEAAGTDTDADADVRQCKRRSTTLMQRQTPTDANLLPPPFMRKEQTMMLHSVQSTVHSPPPP